MWLDDPPRGWEYLDSSVGEEFPPKARERPWDEDRPRRTPPAGARTRRMLETHAEMVTRLLLDYAPVVPIERPLPTGLSLRHDLAVESLSLVALVLRLGDELSADVVASGIDLGQLSTVADLLAVAQRLSTRDEVGHR